MASTEYISLSLGELSCFVQGLLFTTLMLVAGLPIFVPNGIFHNPREGEEPQADHATRFKAEERWNGVLQSQNIIHEVILSL